MGCLKLSYCQKHDRQNVLTIDRGTVPEKSSVINFLTIEEESDGTKNCDNYYPFGLTFNSYQRENSVPNDILYQGQEKQDELNLGWYHFKWRMHDPAIGRFISIDPIANQYPYNSTYAFAENRVVNGVDLEGLEWAPPRGADGKVDVKATQQMIAAYKQLEVKASYGGIIGVKVGNVGVEANFGSKEIGSMSLQNGIQAGADNKVTQGLTVSAGVAEISLQTETTTETGSTEVEVLQGTGLTMDVETTTKTTQATAGWSIMGIGMESSKTKTETTVQGFGTTTTQSASEISGTANQSGSPQREVNVNNNKVSIAVGVKIEIGLTDEKKKP